MTGILRRLTALGYSQHLANHLCAMHTSVGTLDLLICRIEKMEKSNKEAKCHG